MLKPEEEQLSKLLQELMLGLCKDQLSFRTKLTIEGLIGVRVDDDQVLLVRIFDSHDSFANKLALPTPIPSATVHMNRSETGIHTRGMSRKSQKIVDASQIMPDELKQEPDSVDANFSGSDHVVDDFQDNYDELTDNEDGAESFEGTKVNDPCDANNDASMDNVPIIATQNGTCIDQINDTSVKSKSGYKKKQDYVIVKLENGGKDSSGSSNTPSEFHCPVGNVKQSEIKKAHTPSDESKHFTAEYNGKSITAFKCKYCDKVSKRKYSLQRHLAVHDVFLISHLCSICGKKCRDMGQYKDHMEMHNNLSFLCDVCGKCFKTKKLCRLHTRIHQETEKQQCKDCLKFFSTPYMVKAHIRAVHEKEKFECDHCSKEFSYRSSWRSHQARCKDGPNAHIKVFTCPMCSKHLQSKTSLKDHLHAVHLGTIRYSCDKCDYASRYRSDLLRHRRNKHYVPAPSTIMADVNEDQSVIDLIADAAQDAVAVENVQLMMDVVQEPSTLNT